MNPFSGWRSLFLNHIGQIKWQWRTLLFFILYFFGSITAVSLMFTLFPKSGQQGLYQDFIDSLDHLLLALAALIVSWLALKILDKRRLGSLGIYFHSSWRKELAFGLTVGTLIPALIIFGLWLMGFVTLDTRPVRVAESIGGFFISGLLWLSVATYFELAFRGYMLQTMSEGLGKIAGTFFFSFSYGALQLKFVSADYLCAVNFFLAGILYSMVYFRTVSLWAPLGLHFAWNFVQGYILGSPVQAIVGHSSIFVTIPQGGEWMNGGGFGIDGGVVGTLVIGIFLYYVSQSKQLSISDEMRNIKYTSLTTPFIRVTGADDPKIRK
jgi:membrane protease YdiL (CAAX protease family)